MSKRDPQILVADILLAIEKIGRYTVGIDHEMFLKDEKTIDAVVRNIGVIGEAVKQLPDDFKNANPGIPWSQMGGLRNRIVHDYFGLDLEIIWQVIRHDLPQLEALIRAL
ncbi:MAG: HepT-like ribonuclease domain-containing protein [Pyrinomonadaceae bacterium]